jgi:conjugative transfer region protein (TIGR03748 family)
MYPVVFPKIVASTKTQGRYMMKIALWLTTALAFFGSLVWADSVQVSRYAEISTRPSEQQLNPIKTIASFDFPGNVTRVGEAVDVVLQKSGFRLSTASDPDHDVLFNFPLPAVHRQMGPMSIENILQALAGQAYHVSINQRYRTVSFRLQSAQSTAEDVAVEDGDQWFLADHHDSPLSGTHEPLVNISQGDAMAASTTGGVSGQPENSALASYFVKAGDTLSGIGKTLGANDLSHFIDTVYRWNIHAFYNNNKHDLKIASVLSIPPEALL